MTRTKPEVRDAFRKEVDIISIVQMKSNPVLRKKELELRSMWPGFESR